MIANFKSFLLEKGGVSQEEFSKIEPSISIKEFDKGEVLLSNGAICSSMFFVEKGLLRTYSTNEEGALNILQFATEGWIAGDRGSFFFNNPSTFNIDAVEPTNIIQLDRNLLNTIESFSPSFNKYNERLIQNHVRHLNMRIASLLGDSAEVRYLKFTKLYPDVMLRVPQWMVASYLGITPESLSRVRKKLAQKNFRP